MSCRLIHNEEMKPLISVVIPVYQETAVINRTLCHLTAHNPASRFEVILSDGHPEGTTLAVVSDPQVIKVASPLGRGVQMNAGAARAKGDVLLFLHADTFLETGALEKIAGVFDRGHMAAGAFRLAIRSPKWVFRIIEFGVQLRTRLIRLPYGDQAIFSSKAIFECVGGFPDIPVMEDVAFMRRIRKKKGRIVLIDARAFTSPRRWESEGILYCTLRNWMLMILFACNVPTAALARFYPPARP
jgi:rSAM/selenodomain-associated transferase 2